MVGLARNVDQCTDNTGTLYRLIPTARLDAKIKRKQRHRRASKRVQVGAGDWRVN